MTWSAQWEQQKTAFANAAFVEKQAREQQHADNAAQIAQWLQKQRQSGKTVEQLKNEIFALWKDRNRQAREKRQADKQPLLPFSKMPIFKHINLGRTTK